MAPLAWTLRVYWKRYTFAAVASILVSKYAAKRFRDNNIIRAYCRQAKRYGEERVVIAERDGKPGQAKKMVILLNPAANKRDAKLQFMKYSAPLFHLSGIDVTVVESQREGHLRSLMSYIDPQTDYIVVAGGDGTLMEVLTGLMRRTDVEEMRSIPIGILPLGRENRFYQSNLSSTTFKPPVRAIGDATMDIIRSEHTKPLNLMEIKPESGRLLYALSSVQWGPMRDAHENRDGFRLFGRLRLLFSHLNVALQRWPRDYLLHVWYPQYCQLKQDQDTPSPPSEKTTNHHLSQQFYCHWH
ncbi:Acylglycerol kinase, mitochondrial [Geodia barretti]|uniref:Acylglycerol kinase, mitochondrial n=2 Tax=Geodia barretti TaxID=519541 RepID=A0AA35T057_GEOBA|nr:Acylglycerol kinase, mitochondrial [Geodia barretti]